MKIDVSEPNGTHHLCDVVTGTPFSVPGVTGEVYLKTPSWKMSLARVVNLRTGELFDMDINRRVCPLNLKVVRA